MARKIDPAEVYRKRPGFSGFYDKGIQEGLEDEDASRAHQQKIQEARKKAGPKSARNRKMGFKDDAYDEVKKLSREWNAVKGYGNR